MSTVHDTRQRQTQQLQHRRFLYRRRQLSLLIFAVAALCALISVIIGIAIPVSGAAEAEETAAGEISVTEEPVSDSDTETETLLLEETAPGDLVLVNASHSWDDSVCGELISLYTYKSDSYNLRDTEILIDQRILDPLNQMLDDFAGETGCIDMLVCAGYRTKEYQQMLWDNSMETYGEEHTLSYIAVPGTSEHHTGLAVDFAFYHVATGTSYDFDGTGDSAWILEHSWEYGFVQRYPEGKEDITGISTEPWHFRYVGQPHAYLMDHNDLCLEEYLLWLQEYPCDGEHLCVDYDGVSYEIYYTETCRVPTSGEYSVSGDNCGGYIVTMVAD